jgi:hypothetical protein
MLRAEQPIGPFYAIIRGDEPQRYHLGAYCRSARSNDMEEIYSAYYIRYLLVYYYLLVFGGITAQ